MPSTLPCSQEAIHYFDSLPVSGEGHVGSIIEEDSNAAVGELIAEAVFVGVVHPFAHPNKVFMTCQGSRIALSWTERNHTVSDTRRCNKAQTG